MKQLSAFCGDNYELAFSLLHTLSNPSTVSGTYSGMSLDNERVFYVPDHEQNHCRFCGKSVPDVSFRKKAHAVSEFLGNKLILSRNECDACNENFARIESHLASYLQPYNTLWGVHGKRGVPVCKTKDNTGRISTTPFKDFSPSGQEQHWVFAEQAEKGMRIIDLNEKNKSLTVSIERPSHVPSLVYKGLVKIALSLLPHKYLANFPSALSWLNSGSPSFASPMCILEDHFCGEYNLFEHLHLYGFVRNRCDPDFPLYYMLLCYGNLAIQFFVPSTFELEKGRSLRFPTPLDSAYPYESKVVDLSSCEWKRDSVFRKRFDYERHEAYDRPLP